MEQGRIMEAVAPTVRLGATPTRHTADGTKIPAHKPGTSRPKSNRCLIITKPIPTKITKVIHNFLINPVHKRTHKHTQTNK